MPQQSLQIQDAQFAFPQGETTQEMVWFTLLACGLTDKFCVTPAKANMGQCFKDVKPQMPSKKFLLLLESQDDQSS